MLTVRLVDPLTEPEVAVMVVVPVPTADARPTLPAVLLIVATLVADEPQVADVVRSWVVLLL